MNRVTQRVMMTEEVVVVVVVSWNYSHINDATLPESLLKLGSLFTFKYRVFTFAFTHFFFLVLHYILLFMNMEIFFFSHISISA